MKFNKRMLSDWFSAAPQTSRKCGRYGALPKVCLIGLNEIKVNVNLLQV
jgi:hypothetical protein